MVTLPTDTNLYLNVAVVAFIIISLISGWKRGFLWQLIKTVLFVVVLAVCYFLAPGLGDLIQILPENLAPFASTTMAKLFYNNINTIIWFVILFIIGLFLISLLKPLFNVILDLPILKTINRFFGAVFSLIPTFIWLVVLTFLLNSVFFSNGKDMVNKSLLRYTNTVATSTVSFVQNIFKENVAIQKMFSDPKSLTDEDLKAVVEWMNSHQVSADEIREFLTNYGISVNKIQELIDNLTNKN